MKRKAKKPCKRTLKLLDDRRKLVAALHEALRDLTPHEGYQSVHTAIALLRELGEHA